MGCECGAGPDNVDRGEDVGRIDGKKRGGLWRKCVQPIALQVVGCFHEWQGSQDVDFDCYAKSLDEK